MTARLSAPVSLTACTASFARSNVAPMLQEKRTVRPATSYHCHAPHAASEPGQTTKRCSFGRIPITVTTLGRSTDSPRIGTRSRVSSLLVERGIKVTASQVLTAVRTSRNRAGRWLRAASMTAHSVPWLVTWRKRGRRYIQKLAADRNGWRRSGAPEHVRLC